MKIQTALLVLVFTFLLASVNATEGDTHYDTGTNYESDATLGHTSSEPKSETNVDVTAEVGKGEAENDGEPAVIEQIDVPDDFEDTVNGTDDERFGNMFGEDFEEEFEEDELTEEEIQERGRTFRCKKGPGHYCIQRYPYGFIQCDAFGKGFFKRCPPRTKFHAHHQVCVHLNTKIPYCYKHMTAWYPVPNPIPGPPCGRPMRSSTRSDLDGEGFEDEVRSVGTEGDDDSSFDGNDGTSNWFENIDNEDNAGAMADDKDFDVDSFTSNTRFKRAVDWFGDEINEFGDEIDEFGDMGNAEEEFAEGFGEDADLRIVGGSISKIQRWPWQVLIKLGRRPVCGGVIINAKYVLTAASCFRQYKKPQYFKVYYGKSYEKTTEPGERFVSISKIIVHSRYNTPKGDNNIALLKLRTPIKFSSRAVPICLPSPRTTTIPRGWYCYVTGYGYTRRTGGENNLKVTRVPILSHPTCRRVSPKYKKYLTDNMICGGSYRKSGPCIGDTGGPLVCKHPRARAYNLFGIVSYSWGCGDPRKPGVYTKVSKYLRWIRYIIKRYP